MENTQFTQCIWPRRPVRGDYTHPALHVRVLHVYVLHVRVLHEHEYEHLYEPYLGHHASSGGVFSLIQLQPGAPWALAFSGAGRLYSKAFAVFAALMMTMVMII